MVVVIPAGGFARKRMVHHETVADLGAWAGEHALPIVGIDNVPGARDLDASPLPSPVVVLLGQEGPGLSEVARAACTEIVAIGQHGSTRSLNAGVASGIEQLPDSFYRELAREYQAKRDRFCDALGKAGLPPSIPQGAYYVLADVSSLPGITGKDRAMYLLNKTGVAGVPGEAFFSGIEGHHFIRFSFAKTDSDLAEACRRLARFG